LSIAHSIVTSLGGEIRVESAKGQGALFEVILPAAS
jgi:signal transduction histidine kinase